MISKKQVTVWCRDDIISDPEVKKVLTQYGGIKTTVQNSLELAKEFPIENVLYDIGQNDKEARILYLGECGTNRRTYPDTSIIYNRLYADESSPYRMKFLKNVARHIGYSSYRIALFTISTKKSDINFRLPMFPPTFTFKILDWKIGEQHDFIWLDLKKNLHFCYPYRTLLDPFQTEKSWSWKPFMKIPFDWHIKSMLKYAERYNKRVFIYGGDYDANSKEEFLERIKIINKYLE